MLSPETVQPVERRDMRQLNPMTAETRYVHGFLIQWGKWNRDTPMQSSPQSLLGRIKDFGPDGVLCSCGPAPIGDPSPLVQAVENVVRKLCQIDKHVLCVEYVEHWAMRETKAHMARMKPGKYFRTLRRARERVYFGLIASPEFVIDN